MWTHTAWHAHKFLRDLLHSKSLTWIHYQKYINFCYILFAVMRLHLVCSLHHKKIIIKASETLKIPADGHIHKSGGTITKHNAMFLKRLLSLFPPAFSHLSCLRTYCVIWSFQQMRREKVTARFFAKTLLTTHIGAASKISKICTMHNIIIWCLLVELYQKLETRK